MRVQITFDSATTEQVRQLAVALNRAGLEGQLSVGVNGPERWHGATPHLTPNQYATVVSETVKYKGQLVKDAVRADSVTYDPDAPDPGVHNPDAVDDDVVPEGAVLSLGQQRANEDRESWERSLSVLDEKRHTTPDDEPHTVDS